MKRLFALLASVAAATAMAQTRPGTAPTRPLANPFGLSSAIAGQSRPLGGIPAYGNRGRGRFDRNGGHGYGGYGAGVYGYSTYIPGYWDSFGDTGASGPYSSYVPYSDVAPPQPLALPSPGAPPIPPAPPTVIINQYYGYPPPGPGPNGPDQPEGAALNPGAPLSQPDNYYLIVYKDHSIHAALAYWQEGSTLHYVTTDNVHNQISVDLVDIAESTRLNSDHKAPFSITAR